MGSWGGLLWIRRGRGLVRVVRGRGDACCSVGGFVGIFGIIGRVASRLFNLKKCKVFYQNQVLYSIILIKMLFL